MYAIYINDYKIHDSKIIKIFKSKLEGLQYMENLVEDFIKLKNGEINNQTNIFYEPSSMKSRSWLSKPYGFFKTRKPSDSFYKISVWNKIEEPGYLYNSYKIDKIFTIDLISISLDIVNDIKNMEIDIIYNN